MKFSCLHTHSVFCDGANTVEEMCQAAWEAGLVAVGFSSHAPLPLETNWHMQAEKMDEYIETVQAAKKRWQGRLAVFLGLEIDYLSSQFGPAHEYFHQYDFDYRIGAIHYVYGANGTGPFAIDGTYEEWERCIRTGFNGDGEALAEAFWAAVTAMVKAGGFDVVGHLDLIKKLNGTNGRPEVFNPTGKRYLTAARQAIAAIGEAGLVAEINTGALNRGNHGETYPSVSLLQELQQQGTPVIITADAHRAEHIAGHYADAVAVLKKAGYTNTVLFNGSAWVLEPID